MFYPVQRPEADSNKILRAPVMILKLLIVGSIYLVVGDLDMCYNMSSKMLSIEYGDYFNLNKDNELTTISLNINSLRTESWQAKNDMVWDFILVSNIDVIVLQETNMN